MKSLRFIDFLFLLCLSFSWAGSSLAVPTQGHKIVYSGASPYGAEVARDIIARGGNAVDAAVAIALSMAVTHPYYSSFGGGGFAMVKTGGKIRALDFRETAPSKANADLFKGRPASDSQDGGLAVGTPGVAAGLWELHKTFGKLSWAQLFTHAEKAAHEGFRVSGEWAAVTSTNRKRFNSAGRAILFPGKGEPALKPGEILKQPGLAKFLAGFKKSGPKAFYQDVTATEIVNTIAAAGGVTSLDDLKNYKPRWLDPLTVEYAGYRLSLMPPPSSGGVVIASALRLAEKLETRNLKALSSDELHMLSEIMKLSFRGRQLLGDPAFTENPVELLLSQKYLQSLMAQIKPDRVIDVEPLKEMNLERESTTHFSVMTANGDAVAFTVTLNGEYGSGVVTPRSGIALNNEMDDFTTQPSKPNMFGLVQGAANQVRPGARPLSSMSPTIVEKDGRTVLAIGASGGPRIITSVLQVTYRLLSHDFDIDQAIQAPRVHHQFLPNTIRIDPLRFSPDVIGALEKRGHKVIFGSIGRVAGVWRDEKGILSGAADSRGEAAAGGL